MSNLSQNKWSKLAMRLFSFIVVAFCVAFCSCQISANQKHTAQDQYSLAVAFGAKEILHFTDNAFIASGIAINFDAGLVRVSGQQLSGGEWWLPTGAEIEYSQQCKTYAASNSFLNIHGENDDAAEVTCSEGYFACCWCDRNHCPVARCRKDNLNDDDCRGGGNGSTSCSLDRDACP